MSLLIAFSGQGMQHKNMFDILKSNDAGKRWLQEVSDIIHKNVLDENIIDQCLFDPLYAQLFIVALSIGVFRLWESQAPDLSSDILLCGYSLGELSAFCASTQLSMTEIKDVIEKRAYFMQEAAQKFSKNKPCGLAALKGHIDDQSVTSLVNQYHCYVAIINAEDHYIIGGLNTQLDLLLQEAIKNGVDEAKRLHVDLPSHTPMLVEATNNFLDYLHVFQQKNLKYPILNALTVERTINTNNILTVLSNELSHTLHWGKVMSIAQEYEIDNFMELGPDASLKNMAKNYFRNTYALNDFATLEGFLKEKPLLEI